MKRIHNNPKINEARMPVILTEDNVNIWTDPSVEEFTENDLLPFLEPYPNSKLEAFTVPKLIGDFGVGNIQAATVECVYPELIDMSSQGTLF